MEKEKMDNLTYEFIGRLALVLFSQNIKMSYTSLIQVLIDNTLEHYGSERAMASGIAAAYRRWEVIERNSRKPSTTGAIANTYVDKNGTPAWLNY